jgi:sugar lactone lactonase YvrE
MNVSTPPSVARRRSRFAAASVVVLIAMALAGLAAWHTWRHPPLADTSGAWTAVVTTLAGRGTPGFSDDDAGDAEFSDPFGVAIGPDGAVYVADAGENNRIRRISQGRVVTVAGSAREGLADGVGRDAAFHTPSGVAVAADGSLYVADTGNHAVRRITPELNVVTIAGSGTSGYRDGDAIDAEFDGPVGIAVGRDGSVFVADTYNDRIRRIDAAGLVTTVAGSGVAGLVDGAATSARFDTPAGIAVESDRSLLVADSGNHVVRRVDLDAGLVTTMEIVSTDGSDVSLFTPAGIAVGPRGTIYVSDRRGRVVQVQNDGVARLLAGSVSGFADDVGLSARFSAPAGLAVDAHGAVVVADAGNYVIRRLSPPNPSVPAPPRSPSMPRPGEWLVNPAEWRLLWPIDPQSEPREVAGTMGEPRGPAENGRERFHAGLDIQAEHGLEVRAVRRGKIDRLLPAQAHGTINESLSIGPLTYVHLRVGRGRDDRAIDPDRFLPLADDAAQVTRMRVRRGTRIDSGDVIGTVNRFNHVHLNAGPPGREVNPLLLGLPGFTDTVPPSIAPRGIELLDDVGRPFVLRQRRRLVVTGRVRVVVDAWDRSDGNTPSRRLGLFRLGYQVMHPGGRPAAGFEEPRETIRFDRLGAGPDAPRFVYAEGSGIAAYGYRRTRYLYTVTNRLQAGEAEQGFWETRALEDGDYILRVVVADTAGNEAIGDVAVTIANALPGAGPAS